MFSRIKKDNNYMNIIFISNQTYPLGMAGTKRIRLFAESLADNGAIVNIFILAKSNGSNNSSGIHNKVKYQLIKFKYFHLIFGNKSLNQQLVKLYNKQEKNIIYLCGGLSIITAKLLSFASNLGYKIVTDIVEDYSIAPANSIGSNEDVPAVINTASAP